MKNFTGGWMILLVAGFFSCDSPVLHFAEPPAMRAAVINPDPSPAYLSPEESMKTMLLPKGYRLELVASEPVIQEPVAIVWDGNGRMYVAEMRSYMQDINGTGEQLPVCRITRLEDTDGNGSMDKHTVFVDSLVLPRMMLALDDRLVVNETYSYSLNSYRDTNGDGIADEKTEVYHNEVKDNANLEHQRSGLVWNIDNWIYITVGPARFRYTNGKLEADSIYGSNGQWGLAHDSYGRLFYSSAGSETAAHDFQQNPVYGRLGFKNEVDGDFDAVWPSVASPDVQGGKMRQREDSTLNHFTASCGQTVFRGDRLPQSMNGDLFICEPVGRLIRRAKVINTNGVTTLKNAYDKAEFLSSVDMNFRPVNTETGPDGCLYIVDMYHGIIQESGWTTEDSYLRPQILRKNLDKNINRGRIYRLVHDDFKPGPQPRLLDASNSQLVAYLSHPNGWWRDNAQKLLIIHNDKSIVPKLKALMAEKSGLWNSLKFWDDNPPVLGRLHALWTLEGLNAIDKEILKTAFADSYPEVRKAAIRISESFIKKNDEEILSLLEKMSTDSSMDVKIQLALSLRYTDNERAKQLLHTLAADNPGNDFVKVAVKESLQEVDPSLKALRAAAAGMDEEDKELFFKGAANFKQLCATCHGIDGKGLPSGIAPPLAGSPRVNGSKPILINILLKGLKGPVDGIVYPDVMPALADNNDEYIASVATFIRNSFGNDERNISPREVEKVRTASAGREKSWTLKELSGLKSE